MNTIQLIGRLSQDPELRYTNSGMATTTLRLAVPRRKRNGEDQAPVYVDVVTFDKQAEAVARLGDYVQRHFDVSSTSATGDHPRLTPS